MFLPSSFYGENAMESISSKPPSLLSTPLAQDSPLPRQISLCIPYTHAAMDSLVMGRRSHSHTVTHTGIRAIHFLPYLHYVDTMIYNWVSINLHVCLFISCSVLSPEPFVHVPPLKPCTLLHTSYAMSTHH